MNTNALIGVKNPDGTVSYVGSRYDGYLSHNGVILFLYWNSLAAAAALIAQGSIDSLGPEMGEKHDPRENVRLDSNATVFWARDRNGPEHAKVAVAGSVDEFLTAPVPVPFGSYNELSYRYLFDNGWFVKVEDGDLMPVEQAIIERVVVSGEVTDYGVRDIDFNDHVKGQYRVAMREIADLVPDWAVRLRTDKPTFPELHIEDIGVREAVQSFFREPDTLAA